MNTPAPLTQDQETVVQILVLGTEYRGVNHGISKELAEEIVRLACAFPDPILIEDFFLEAANSNSSVNLWELLQTLRETLSEWSYRLTTAEFRTALELRIIRQKFGF